MAKEKMAYFRQNASKKLKKIFWSLRMVQVTIKIAKDLNPPCWTFMTVCTLLPKFFTQRKAFLNIFRPKNFLKNFLVANRNQDSTREQKRGFLV
jgi:hypothetical protein